MTRPLSARDGLAAVGLVPPVREVPDLVVKLAETPEEIAGVHRLRHRVFVVEAGLAPEGEEREERDAFDAACDHLIVKDVGTGVVAGCYRMLPGARRGALGFYTESEFDLAAFLPRAPRTMELGRSCVHPDYRRGPAMRLLWNAMLARFLASHRYLIGCVSVPAEGLGGPLPPHPEGAPASRPVVPACGRALRALNEVYTFFAREGALTDRYGIRPRVSHRIEGVRLLPDVDVATVRARLPALVKGYLLIGGEVVCEPVYDPLLRTVDFCMVLDRERMPDRVRARALRQG